MKRVSPAYSRI